MPLYGRFEMLEGMSKHANLIERLAIVGRGAWQAGQPTMGKPLAWELLPAMDRIKWLKMAEAIYNEIKQLVE